MPTLEEGRGGRVARRRWLAWGGEPAAVAPPAGWWRRMVGLGRGGGDGGGRGKWRSHAHERVPPEMGGGRRGAPTRPLPCARG